MESRILKGRAHFSSCTILDSHSKYIRNEEHEVPVFDVGVVVSKFLEELSLFCFCTTLKNFINTTCNSADNLSAADATLNSVFINVKIKIGEVFDCVDNSRR